jgi:acetyl-CoA carboxylase beta subunit
MITDPDDGSDRKSRFGSHAFVPGASGTGHTNTIVRLVNSATARQCVVIVNCKNGGADSR